MPCHFTFDKIFLILNAAAFSAPTIPTMQWTCANSYRFRSIFDSLFFFFLSHLFAGARLWHCYFFQLTEHERHDQTLPSCHRLKIYSTKRRWNAEFTGDTSVVVRMPTVLSMHSPYSKLARTHNKMHQLSKTQCRSTQTGNTASTNQHTTASEATRQQTLWLKKVQTKSRPKVWCPQMKWKPWKRCARAPASLLQHKQQWQPSPAGTREPGEDIPPEDWQSGQPGPPLTHKTWPRAARTAWPATDAQNLA